MPNMAGSMRRKCRGRITDIRPIRNEADYDAQFESIEVLMGATPGTPKTDAVEVLVTPVEAYETRRWPVDTSCPVSMVEHVREACGYRQKDFAALVGPQPHASEVL